MKEIKAIVRPNRLQALRSALAALPGFPGMSVSRVEGCSAPQRAGTSHSIRDELVEYSPKLRIEIVASDDLVQAIVECIVASARTGAVGDGLVWVGGVEVALMIHGGEAAAGQGNRPAPLAQARRGQDGTEGAAASDLAFDLQAPAVAGERVLDDGQAKPGAPGLA